MNNTVKNITLALKPGEIVQVICEGKDLEILKFDRIGRTILPALTAEHPYIVAFEKEPAFQPPTIGAMLLRDYVAQKTESTPGPKISVNAWLEAFLLKDYSGLPLLRLPEQAHYQLQMLQALTTQPAVIQMEQVSKLDEAGKLLWNIRSFGKNSKNGALLPAFVIRDTDLTPSTAFIVERILAIENGALLELHLEY